MICVAAGLFTFMRLPPNQWKSTRTLNAIERLHEEFERRIKTQTMLPSADAAASTRALDGLKSWPQSRSIGQLTWPPNQIASRCRRLRHSGFQPRLDGALDCEVLAIKPNKVLLAGLYLFVLPYAAKGWRGLSM